MKHSDYFTFQNIILALLGPVLLVSIYFAANNALQTYVDGEKSRQTSAWSVLQLYKEMRKVNFQAELYIHDRTSASDLRLAYEILWSRISVTHSSLLNDEIFIRANHNDLNTLLEATFTHIKAIELIISGEAPLDKRHLIEWIVETEKFGNTISMSLLHDLISTNSDYAKIFRNKVFKAAGLLLLSTLAIILYLGYLLFALWMQRKHHKYLLDHDSLTGLYSRDYTMKLIKSHCDKQVPFTLLSFDINKFKSTNDTMGHLAGDDLLKHLAVVTNKSLGQYGTVGRIGGDEFLCIIESEELSEVNEYYSHFLRLIENPFSIQGYPVYLQVSTGACLVRDCNFNSNLLLERVDEAMYRSKKISQKVIFWSGNPIKAKEPFAKLVKSSR
ncbi:GGDEF domain-containing protein [Leucothrix arctica]|uniref:GGDEF domain-containing protein n=1 Tax=Leucothrix arctica TaxID=1481894 RepID=A0A317C528_9GAMM|nr:GGDEF domain-containing protein [Leucothrix arctica]PWQ93755.1 hypothetical protein DKT75_19285 [Leucothrix arctica]